ALDAALSPFSPSRSVHLRDLHSFPTRRSSDLADRLRPFVARAATRSARNRLVRWCSLAATRSARNPARSLALTRRPLLPVRAQRSQEHTSEPQSRFALVCRLVLRKKKASAIAQ